MTFKVERVKRRKPKITIDVGGGSKTLLSAGPYFENGRITGFFSGIIERDELGRVEVMTDVLRGALK